MKHNTAGMDYFKFTAGSKAIQLFSVYKSHSNLYIYNDANKYFYYYSSPLDGSSLEYVTMTSFDLKNAINPTFFQFTYDDINKELYFSGLKVGFNSIYDNPFVLDSSFNGYDGYANIALVGTCPDNYYNINNKCISCPINSRKTNDPLATSKSSCKCNVPFVGSDCSSIKCSTVLPKFTLGDLLLLQDINLQYYSKSFNNTKTIASLYILESASSYISELISVQVDLNGDTFISQYELLTVLKSKSVISPGLEIM
jgi:hypothetical protein